MNCITTNFCINLNFFCGREIDGLDGLGRLGSSTRSWPRRPPGLRPRFSFRHKYFNTEITKDII